VAKTVPRRKAQRPRFTAVILGEALSMRPIDKQSPTRGKREKVSGFTNVPVKGCKVPEVRALITAGIQA